MQLSLVLITCNAATSLERCLQSAGFAQEVLVVDSGSTDHTVALAKQLGARVIYQPWLGFGLQKQFAVQQAKYDWVLCLDADEWVSAELAQEIQALPEKPAYWIWKMPRCNQFMGRFLRYGEGYPDWNVRLFHRDHAQWSDDAVHEKVCFSESAGTLKGDLLHDSGETISHYLNMQNNYTELQATILHAQHKDISAVKMAFSPLVRFLKFYVWRKGFLDGVPGLVHISIGCMNSLIKYAKLRELQRKDAKI